MNSSHGIMGIMSFENKNPIDNPMKPFHLIDVGKSVTLAKSIEAKNIYKDRFNCWHDAEIIVDTVSIKIIRHDIVDIGYGNYQYIEVGQDDKGMIWKRRESNPCDGMCATFPFRCKMLNKSMEIKRRKSFWGNKPVIEYDDLTDEEKEKWNKDKAGD